MKTIVWLASAALVLGSHAGTPQAQERFYLGASAGSSDIDEDIALGLITSGSVDGSDSGTKFYGGFRFGPNFALELGFVDLGRASYSGDFFGSPVTGGKVKVSGFNTSAVLQHAINPRFELFGKVGLFAWDLKASDTTGGVPFSAKDDGADLSLGFGANYFFTKNVGARVEWEHFAIDSVDASMLSAGIIAKF